jgi:hypothetical protein
MQDTTDDLDKRIMKLAGPHFELGEPDSFNKTVEDIAWGLSLDEIIHLACDSIADRLHGMVCPDCIEKRLVHGEKVKRH